jgi:hypothetical protein
MSERFASHERELCEMFANAAHGPRRNGLFAVWLILRVSGDAIAESGLSERARRRRSEALARRLASLNLPDALRSSVRETAELTTLQSLNVVPDALRDLIPTVRDTLGVRAAAVLTAAADEAAR